jgi:hypothetical protein
MKLKTNTVERIVELRPSLPETTRAAIADMAENAPQRELELDLTAEDDRLIEQAQDDFKHGRTLTLEQYKAKMDVSMAELAARANKRLIPSSQSKNSFTLPPLPAKLQESDTRC